MVFFKVVLFEEVVKVIEFFNFELKVEKVLFE